MKRTLHDAISELARLAEGGVQVIPADDLQTLVDKHPPPAFTTEWGVAWELPGDRGTSWGLTREGAGKMTYNMRSAGHQARVVWRGVTDAQEA